jgi:hypothetical protein
MAIPRLTLAPRCEQSPFRHPNDASLRAGLPDLERNMQISVLIECAFSSSVLALRG